MFCPAKKQVVGSWALFHNHVRSGKLRGFLRAAAKAPMQGSCSYSASWRRICVVHAALGVLLVLVPAAQAQEVVALGLFLTRPV